MIAIHNRKPMIGKSYLIKNNIKRRIQNTGNMNLTQFQRDIIERLISCIPEENHLLCQIDQLTLEGLEHNGNEILYKYKSALLPDKQTGENVVFDGLEIFSSELNAGASAAVFLKNGLISFLQILSHSGEFPERELTDYTLINNLLEKECTGS